MPMQKGKVARKAEACLRWGHRAVARPRLIAFRGSPQVFGGKGQKGPPAARGGQVAPRMVRQRLEKRIVRARAVPSQVHIQGMDV